MRARHIVAAGLFALLTVTGCGAAGGGASGATTQATTPRAVATPAGNGVAALGPDEITAKARTAFLAAPSVHVKGSVTSGTSVIGLDLRVRQSGGGDGVMVMDGGKLRLLVIGKVAYLSGDRTFWEQAGIPAATAKTLVGKYVRTTSADKDFSQLLAFSDVRQLAENFLPKDGLAVEGKATLAGTRVVTLKDATDARYSVALDGPAYPVRLVGKDGADAISLDFLDYGKDVPLTAPPAAQVLDASRLHG